MTVGVGGVSGPDERYKSRDEFETEIELTIYVLQNWLGNFYHPKQ